MRVTHILGAVASLCFAGAAPFDVSQLPQGATDTPANRIISIAPETASCAGAPFPSECATAEEAATAFIDSVTEYGLSTKGEWGAVFSLILFESGNFKYNRNHFPAPGVPGQGTRNMQSPTYNAQYAQFLAGKGQLAAEDVTNASADDVLDLLSPDKFSFASAAWFLVTVCSPDVKESLKDGTQASYEGYLTGCVGTAATPDRLAVWEQVQTIL